MLGKDKNIMNVNKKVSERNLYQEDIIKTLGNPLKVTNVKSMLYGDPW